MKIAIAIDGQFLRRTGIQYYSDSLLNGLYALDTPHKIVGFAPTLWSAGIWEQVKTDGFFEWHNHPKSSVDSAGSSFHLTSFPQMAKSAVLWRFATVIDGRIINPIKQQTNESRARRAAARYNVVHIPDAARPELLTYRGKHTVATIHDVTTITRPRAHDGNAVRIWGDYFHFAKEHCARVLTVSEHSKQDIMQHLGISEDRIDVTPLAPRSSAQRVTDGGALAAVRETFGLGDAPFVLYAGTLEPRKNLVRLIEAFAAVVQQERLTEHRLVLAGGHWDRHDEELRRRAEALGVGEQVALTGYVSNAQMNALMSSCAVFAYVSEYEGFGLPPLEAMACGAAVVASNTTSLPEVVGDAGVQVDPLNVGEIAGALHLLLTDAGENARRRELSLARAGEFSWERTARLTVQSYEAAVA